MPKRTEELTTLHRSSSDYYLAGVAGGLGEYFKVDPLIFRVLFIILTIFGGSGILLYILLWILMPEPNRQSGNSSRFHEFAHNLGNANFPADSRKLLGGVLLILGLIFLLDNLGIFQYFDLTRVWPVILIILGLLILSRHG